MKRKKRKHEVVYKEKENKDVKKMEKEFWKDYNALCKSCQESCKQSYLATVVCCPQYKKK